MLKKHLTLALAALVATVGCAPYASAQSGRQTSRAYSGRGLSGREAIVSESSAAREETGASAHATDARAAGFDLRKLNAGRTASAVYAENGEYHLTRGDKIAGAALLGYLILFVAIMATSDGYAPKGGFAPAGSLQLRQ